MFANMVIWLHELVVYRTDTGPFYESNTFTEFYLWNLVDVFFVVVNGTSNFVIYLTRKRSFRTWIVNTFRHWNTRSDYNSPLPRRSTNRSSKSSSRSSIRSSLRASYRRTLRESSRINLRNNTGAHLRSSSRINLRAVQGEQDGSPGRRLVVAN